MRTAADPKLALVPDAPTDLEAALAAAEERGGGERGDGERGDGGHASVEGEVAAAEPAAEPAAAEPAAAAAAAEPATPEPTPEPATEPRAATPPRSPAQGSSVALPLQPPSLRVGRPRLIPSQKDALLGRQAAWTAWSALAGAVFAATGFASQQPLVALTLSVGVGAWAAFPRRILRAPALALATVGAALLTSLVLAHDPTLLVAGPELLVAGAVAGGGLTFLDPAPADRWRRLHGALGGAAAVGVGWWAATGLVGPVGSGTAIAGAMHGAVLGLVASQALVAAGLAWFDTDRVPRPARIRATLAETYRPPVLRAWQLDQAFEKQAPDPESRDGLGEVAAWVYRLQWTLQALDRELDALDHEGLDARRRDIADRARAAGDEFTRDRLQATAQHLDKLDAHRQALARERDRSEAMREYASAFLEEARAGLALAQVQPGDHVPERLGDVLTRLRSHAAERDAHRRTARELGAFA